jgi:histidine triad (HIT) family protein
MTPTSTAVPGSCAFREIVAGRTPAPIVASDALTVAFLDLRQFHPGHVLVVPRAPLAADQEVPHLHFHVHPRRLHDGVLRVYPNAPACPERGTLDQWGARLRAALAALVLLWAMPASAQPAERFEAAVHVAAATIPQFEGSDFGVGGRLAWRPDDLLSFEGELTLFPGEFPDSAVPFSRRRVEGLFGVTAGLRLGRLRPFAKFRAGFLDVQQAPQPFACILIFPPPLSCTLGAGRTLPAFDVGGGVEVDVTARTFLRIEAGDRMLKYPGPALEGGRIRPDDSFYGHGLRFAAGAGVRF